MTSVPDARSLWGHHYDRFAAGGIDRPHRLLALDGGGIRGVLTLEILAEMESQLGGVRLGDYFDYIAGTSTGAIIAAGLARGMSAQELLDFYVSIGAEMFEKSRLLHRLKHMYKSDPLAAQLQRTFGEDTLLGSDTLRCLLLAITRNVTTDSPWPISSAPTARYNATDRRDCNLKIPLWQLVRASTAAPIYFPPEVLEWEAGNPDKSFVFVDGGMTPYNNPAFVLFRMATTPAYRVGWPTGEQKLMLVSVGTGSASMRGPDAQNPETNIAATLAGLPGALMDGAATDQDVNCRVIGRCVYGAPIDREIGDLIPRGLDGRSGEPSDVHTPLNVDLGRQFLYARYDADLSDEGLQALNVDNVDAKAVRKLDAVDQIDALRRIGRAAGRKQVRLTEQFGTLAAVQS